MVVNISYIEVPIWFQEHKNFKDDTLKENLFLTGSYSTKSNYKEDKHPRYTNMDIEWSKLRGLIKSDFRQYSPYRFPNGIKCKSGSFIDKQNLLIFDIDDGIKIEEMRDIFKGFKHLISTTKRHSENQHRFRFIMPCNDIPSDAFVYQECLDIVSRKIEMDEGQNHIAGAFLGYSGCEFYENDGDMFSMAKLVEIANENIQADIKRKKKLELERSEYIKSMGDSFDIDVALIKESLDIEAMKDIIGSLGYEIYRDKFKLREERSPSAKIYADGGITDFGSNEHMDIFSVVMRTMNISFLDSVKYVNKFIGG